MRICFRSTGERELAAMLKIEIEREQDGRWIGEVPELPGVLAYGATEAEARVKTTALAPHQYRACGAGAVRSQRSLYCRMNGWPPSRRAGYYEHSFVSGDDRAAKR